MTKVIIPLNAYRAISKATSQEGTTSYLQGVLVESNKLVSTNRSVLLTYDLSEDTGVDEEQPIVLKVDVNEKAMKPNLAMLDGPVFMHVDTERLLVETFVHNEEGQPAEARLGVCGCEIIDSKFPNYENVIPNYSTEEDKEPRLSADIAFQADLIAVFSAAAKCLGVKKPIIRFESGLDRGAQVNVLFHELGRLKGVLMPCRRFSAGESSEDH